MPVMDTPETRTTRLANDCLNRAELSEYWRHDDRVVVLVYPEADDEQPGVGAVGVESAVDLVTAMLIHLRGIMSAMGKRLDLMTEDGFIVGPDPEDTDADGS